MLFSATATLFTVDEDLAYCCRTPGPIASPVLTARIEKLASAATSSTTSSSRLLLFKSPPRC